VGLAQVVYGPENAADPLEGTHAPLDLPLAPLTLVVRVWRSSDSRLLRGQMQIHGSDFWVPIQSHAQLEQLIRTWLLPQSAAGHE